MNNKKFVIGIVVVIALVAGLAVYFVAHPFWKTPPAASIPSRQNSVVPQPQPPQAPATTSTSTASKPAAKPKLSKTATITGVVLSKAVAATGAPLNPGTVFSSSTPSIYAVLSLKNAIQRTKLSYIRYFEGKYVDAKVSHPTKDGGRYFYFEFALKPGQTRKAGHYTLNLYINDKKAQSVSFIVR